MGIVDEFIVISAHIVVVPEGIAGMRFNDIGVGAEAVRVVFGVDNGVVLREKVGEKVSFLQAIQRDLLV